MWLFRLFKKKKTTLSEDDKKWNKMWDMWCNGEVPSPYAELMEYQSQVNNGGHCQFFDNVSTHGVLDQVVTALYTVLDDTLSSTLKNAYNAYLNYEDNLDVFDVPVCEFDKIFYEHEEKINNLLKEYSKTIII